MQLHLGLTVLPLIIIAIVFLLRQHSSVLASARDEQKMLEQQAAALSVGYKSDLAREPSLQVDLHKAETDVKVRRPIDEMLMAY